MCTVMAYRAADTHVGRNLDLEGSFGEQLTVLPRRAPFAYRQMAAPSRAYAIMGMAYTPQEQPLFFDALNERGVYMAGLNFPLWASYESCEEGGVAPFELIPYVLRQCATAREAADVLARTPLAAIAYNDTLPLTPLHWFLCDTAESFAAEPLADGWHITPDTADVLTNSPPLSYHLIRLAEYTALSPTEPPSTFGSVPAPLYSRGMGTIGLPGDWSSSSRFVRAAYLRQHAPWMATAAQARAHTWRMMDAVSFPKGCVAVGERQEYTVYTSCASLREGRYAVRTYEGEEVHVFSFDRVNVDGETVLTNANISKNIE